MRRFVAFALALAIIIPITAQARGGARGGHSGARFVFHHGFFRGPFAAPVTGNTIVPPLATLPEATRGTFGIPSGSGAFGGDFATFGGGFGTFGARTDDPSGSGSGSDTVQSFAFVPAAMTSAPPVVTRMIVNEGHGVFSDQAIEQGTHGVFRFNGQKTVLVERRDGGAKIIEFSQTQVVEAGPSD